MDVLKNKDMSGIDISPLLEAINPPTEPCEKVKRGPIIKHIVIGGAGAAGFISYGVLQEAEKQHMWKLKNIQTFYGCSVGAYLVVALSLDYDWRTLDEFFIERPWHDVFKYDLHCIAEAFCKKGIYGRDVFEKMIHPLLLGKDLDVEITMQGFYEFTKKEIHIMIVNAHTLELVDVSYKTHPDWPLFEVISASCALPVIFTPIKIGDNHYLDGGVLNNYPIHDCIRNGADSGEIMGINLETITKENVLDRDDSTIFDYITAVISTMLQKISTYRKHVGIPYEFVIDSAISIKDIFTIASDMDMRMRWIDRGVSKVVEFLGGKTAVLNKNKRVYDALRELVAKHKEILATDPSGNNITLNISPAQHAPPPPPLKNELDDKEQALKALEVMRNIETIELTDQTKYGFDDATWRLLHAYKERTIREGRKVDFGTHINDRCSDSDDEDIQNEMVPAIEDGQPSDEEEGVEDVQTTTVEVRSEVKSTVTPLPTANTTVGRKPKTDAEKKAAADKKKAAADKKKAAADKKKAAADKKKAAADKKKAAADKKKAAADKKKAAADKKTAAAAADKKT